MDARWEALTQEAVQHLQALLRFDTTNPPGNELPAIEYVAGVLRAEGVEPIVLESAPQRGNLVARLAGDGSLPPLLLYSHLDVVPAEPAQWTHPPFSGDIADGCIWGRGALDMKSVTVMQLMAFLNAKRQGAPLHRDVILAATSDEEIDSDVGAAWLVKHHPDLVRAEYGLSEMGGQTVHIEGKRFYPVMTAEKGTCWLRVRATGRPGHGAVPHTDNAVVHLARALERVAARPLPLRLTLTATACVQRIAHAVGGSTGLLLTALLQPLLHDAALWAIPDRSLADSLHAILHNTVSPTMLRAGSKVNVIPSEAEAWLDGRVVPGCDVETFLDEVRSRLGKSFEIEIEHASPALESPAGTPLFRSIERRLNMVDPGAVVMPYMAAGASDAKLFAQLGTHCYGFAPMLIEPGDAFDGLIHGHDERITLKALAFGVRVLADVVDDFCAAR